MELLLALGWAGIALLIGMLLRAKIGFLKKFLVPSCVLAGIIGFAAVNLVKAYVSEDFFSTDLYADIVNQMFIISFISIGLTKTAKAKTGETSNAKNIFRGALGMGLIWCVLYALTPILAGLTIQGVNFLTESDMSPEYGLLIPFAFAQGPGQAATFGANLFEANNFENAVDVGVTFAAVGFLVAFIIGVPLARAGLKKGLGVFGDKASLTRVDDGTVHTEEQTENAGIITCKPSNIDTFTFHVALTCIVYIGSYYLTSLIAALLGPELGATMKGMQFMMGLLIAYAVKAILKACKIDYLLNSGIQKRITGFTTDYLVVCSFMAIQISLISKWLWQILAVVAVCSVVTYFVCIYFGKRLGGKNSFERILGLFGTSTGTVPTGIALVRIVDPELATTTATELGAMNITMFASTFVVVIVTYITSGKLNLYYGYIGMAIVAIVLLVLLKVCGFWKNPNKLKKEENK